MNKYLIILALLAISCKSEQKQNIESKIAANKIKEKKVARQSKSKNSEILFSEFKENMNRGDFEKTVRQLIKDRKMYKKGDTLFYKLYPTDMQLLSDFRADQLKNITLIGDLETWRGESVYEFYAEKYKLPALVKVNKYYKKQNVPNTDYAPIYEIRRDIEGKKIWETLPNSLKDTSSEPNSYDFFMYRNWEYSIYQSRPDMFQTRGIPLRYELDETRLALANDSYQIDKSKNVVITITEHAKPSSNIDYVYYLASSNVVLPYSYLDRYGVGKDDSTFRFSDYNYDLFDDHKPLETIGNYIIRKNSRYVTLNYFKDYELHVEYMSKEYHKNEADRLKIKEKKEKDDRKRHDQLNREADMKLDKSILDAI